jgi:hypothetical protein
MRIQLLRTKPKTYLYFILSILYLNLNEGRNTENGGQHYRMKTSMYFHFLAKTKMDMI